MCGESCEIVVYPKPDLRAYFIHRVEAAVPPAALVAVDLSSSRVLLRSGALSIPIVSS